MDNISLTKKVDFSGSADVLNYAPINTLSGATGVAEVCRLIGNCGKDQIGNPLGSAMSQLHREWQGQTKREETTKTFPVFVATYAARWENRRQAAISLADKVTFQKSELKRLFGHHDIPPWANSIGRWLYGLTKGKGASAVTFKQHIKDCGGSIDQMVETFMTNREVKNKNVA